ncbi:hypothetical protein GCM10022393_27600 [Aquimarina addita]|uniref:histidine kinase n=1 Tax=Aquimarina addita TaxID=870485 RepID=A0ABP6UPZ4_9FLAO
MMCTLGNFSRISFYRVHIYFFITFFFISNISTIINAQEIEDKEVEKSQRAIFIFNLAQQIGWSDTTLETFNIGVLGPDDTYINLKTMAQKRKVFGKPVNVYNFQSVKSVKDIQLLYVNNKYNYSMDHIFNKIKGKHILLVTEDFDYNTSMINMIHVGNSFEYEINTSRIENEGFIIAPSLKKYGITSSEKWKGLFRTTEKSLERVMVENEEQKIVIKNKEEKIEQQEEKIFTKEKALDNIQEKVSERNKIIQALFSEGKIREKKYEEKLLIKKELEEGIQKQLEFIKIQEEKIKVSAQEIDRQHQYQNELNTQVRDQEAILEQQLLEINNQKKINILLIILAVFIILISFFIYRSYLHKKRLNASLEEKNQEIYHQSKVLESKNKELEQFAYIASHDLQEPLNTISSFIGLIAEDYGDKFDEAGKDSLTFIQDASKRMKKLINALLEYSRLGRSKDFIKVDLTKIMEELKADFTSILERTNAKLTVNTLPVVKGSEIELRLLIQNLVSNAIKFTEEDVVPEVTISAVKKTKIINNVSSQFWEFAIKDNGIGIPEKHKDRIFAIFQRLHSREKYQGTGIGLAHCKKIVEAHGGEIWLKSIEGQGTTFYFTIPG